MLWHTFVERDTEIAPIVVICLLKVHEERKKERMDRVSVEKKIRGVN